MKGALVTFLNKKEDPFYFVKAFKKVLEKVEGSRKYVFCTKTLFEWFCKVISFFAERFHAFSEYMKKLICLYVFS